MYEDVLTKPPARARNRMPAPTALFPDDGAFIPSKPQLASGNGHVFDRARRASFSIPCAARFVLRNRDRVWLSSDQGRRHNGAASIATNAQRADDLGGGAGCATAAWKGCTVRDSDSGINAAGSAIQVLLRRNMFENVKTPLKRAMA